MYSSATLHLAAFIITINSIANDLVSQLRPPSPAVTPKLVCLVAYLSTPIEIVTHPCPRAS